MILGLTGRIASGKNLTADILSKNDYFVIDVDVVGHEILATQSVASEVLKAFGPEIMAGTVINRKALGDLVFRDRTKLEMLERLLHPLMKKRVIDLLAGSQQHIVINAAVLFEMELDVLCHKILVVDAPDEIIIERLRHKGYTPDDAEHRLHSQQSRDYYLSKADFVIENFGSLPELQNKVHQLLLNFG